MAFYAFGGCPFYVLNQCGDINAIVGGSLEWAGEPGNVLMPVFYSHTGSIRKHLK